MIRNIFFIILLTSTFGCGFEPMHSKGKLMNANFSIKKIDFEGDREINIKIKEKLDNYSIEKKDKDFILKINSNSTKTITAKDSKGDPSVFKLDVKVFVQAKNGNKKETEIIISEDFKYNNINDSFELKRYEKEIKISLTEAIVKNLIFKLSNFQ
jgi:hypothetical protein|tara:strand:- start:474 stop:938 length:465 start_codon:yes stop_codon:yes gene_type:complete